MSLDEGTNNSMMVLLKKAQTQDHQVSRLCDLEFDRNSNCSIDFLIS